MGRCFEPQTSILLSEDYYVGYQFIINIVCELCSQRWNKEYSKRLDKLEEENHKQHILENSINNVSCKSNEFFADNKLIPEEPGIGSLILSQRLDTSDRKDSQILSSNSNSLDLISTNPVDKSLKKFKSTGEKTFTHKSDLFTDVPYVGKYCFYTN